MNKEIIANNIRLLTESKYYYDVYSRLVNDNYSLDYKEEISAQIFNTILFVSQLVDDVEIIKDIVIDILKLPVYDTGGMLLSDQLHANIYLNIIKKYNIQYNSNGYNKMLDKLKHGVAIHFTTYKIMENINSDGVLYAHNSMFDKEIENKILYAIDYQRTHSKDNENMFNYLSQGFGFSKGISMGAQTVAYWMNHTPESLSFLFGGYVYTRDKKAAMRHVCDCVSLLPQNLKDEIINILDSLWDKLVGSDKRLGCILISRDSLEYETYTDWNNCLIELRPYNDSFDDFCYTEESRYHKDIFKDGFECVTVPSIMQLEEYRKMVPVSNDERIRNDYVEEIDDSELDFIFK